LPLALARGYNCKDLEALAKIGVNFWLKPVPIEFLQKIKFFLLQGLFPDLVGILKVQHTTRLKETLQEVQLYLVFL